MKAVIIGNSAAGISAAATLRSLRPDASIFILSKENEAGYSPSLLTHYIAGETPRRRIVLYPKKWYQDQNIDLRLNHEVVQVDFKKKRLYCAENRSVGYDVLLIASGASPIFAFPFDATHKRISGLRTVEDANKVRKWSKQCRSVTVVGGGFVGLKLAGCLKKRNMEVSILEMGPRVLGNAII